MLRTDQRTFAPSWSRPLGFSAALLGALLAAGCSGGGSSGGSLGSATFDLLVQDAPVDDLLSVELTVEELHLVASDSTETPNLIDEPTRLELLGLQTKFGWVGSGGVATGTYEAVRVVIEPGSVETRAGDGSAVPVTEFSNEFTAPLAAPLVVANGDYGRLLVDIDLSGSLEGDVEAPPLLFDAFGFCEVDDLEDAEDPEIDEVLALVREFDAMAGELLVDAYLEDDLSSGLGEITLRLAEGALLVRDDGQAFTSEVEFFASLLLDASLLEVSGILAADGALVAYEVEVEDHAGGQVSAGNIEIEGFVTSVTPGVSFGLLIREVEKGEDTVEAVLLGEDDPEHIDVALDELTGFFLGGLASDDGALAVGQVVDVRFDDFLAPPFVASVVRVEQADSEFEGEVVNVSGLPTSFVIRLDDDNLHVESGDVESESTDVTVVLADAVVFGDIHGDPELGLEALASGLEVEVSGQLSGTPSEPVITATMVEVEPGELEGMVVDLLVGDDGGFVVQVEDVDGSFGGEVGMGFVQVVVPLDALVHGDLKTLEAIQDALMDVSGVQIFVEVQGLSTGEVDTVVALEVEVEIQVELP